jgi:hypothetical protein
MATNYSTREEWLVAAIAAVTPRFEEAEAVIPPVRVSVGWPGGRGKKGTVIGQCWPSSASRDGVVQVFVSPVLDDAVRVLDVLMHELVHAADDCQNGHKGPFVRIARAIGLEGKPTATVAGDDLREDLEAILGELGPYPHAALGRPMDGADGPKKQGTRMLKVECAEGSGYTVRTTRKWLDEYGAPLCPCHQETMVEA